jgi:hypothetical protein
MGHGEWEAVMDQDTIASNKKRPRRIRWAKGRDKNGLQVKDRCQFYTTVDPPWVANPPLTQRFISDYNLRGTKIDFLVGKQIPSA